MESSDIKKIKVL